jgi:hypothetical protein
MKKENIKEPEKCGFEGCYSDATWKGTSTKESIEKIKDREVKKNKHLFKVGQWHYCDKHHDVIAGYSPHLEFERL